MRGWHSAGTSVSPRLAAVGSESMRPYTVRGSLWMRPEQDPLAQVQWKRRGGSERGPRAHPSQEPTQTNGGASPGTRRGLQRPRPTSLGGPWPLGGAGGQDFPVKSQMVKMEGFGDKWSPPNSAQLQAARNGVQGSGVTREQCSSLTKAASGRGRLSLPQGHGWGG